MPLPMNQLFLGSMSDLIKSYEDGSVDGLSTEVGSKVTDQVDIVGA